MTGDEIILTIPREEPFHEVAHLVLGGVAARLDLTFESIDDLETALDAVLERAAEDGDVTVQLRLADGAIVTRVGPFAADRLRAELERDSPDEVTLRRVLDTVVDSYELDAAVDVEAVDRLDQPDRADLDEVLELLAAVAVAPRQRAHEREVLLDELLARCEVALLVIAPQEHLVVLARH